MASDESQEISQQLQAFLKEKEPEIVAFADKLAILPIQGRRSEGTTFTKLTLVEPKTPASKTTTSPTSQTRARNASSISMSAIPASMSQGQILPPPPNGLPSNVNVSPPSRTLARKIVAVNMKGEASIGSMKDEDGDEDAENGDIVMVEKPDLTSKHNINVSDQVSDSGSESESSEESENGGILVQCPSPKRMCQEIEGFPEYDDWVTCEVMRYLEEKEVGKAKGRK